VELASEYAVLVIQVGSHRGERVQLSVQFGDSPVGRSQLGLQLGDRLVSSDLAGRTEDRERDLGVPLGENGLGPVDTGMADVGFASQVLLGDRAVGAEWDAMNSG
jgi:hypothetical protein